MKDEFLLDAFLSAVRHYSKIKIFSVMMNPVTGSRLSKWETMKVDIEADGGPIIVRSNRIFEQER
jgi:hypothetical protein